MPTYQYSCTGCGRAMEVVQSFSEDSLTVCPECGGRLRKVYGAVGVVFKGSGFYRNDSRGKDTSETGSSPAKESAPAAKDSGSGSGSKDSGSKDSGSKDSGSKDSGSKDSGSTSSGSKDSAPAAKASST